MGSLDTDRTDAGHDRLLLLLEKLRYNPDPFLPVVEELGMHLREHCRDEEELMRTAKYRGWKVHAAEHRALLDLLGRELPAEWGRAEAYEEVLAAVDRARQGLLDHIQGRDRDLALHLLRRQQREQAARRRSRAGARRPATRTGSAVAA